MQSVEQSIEWFDSNKLPVLICLDIQLSDDLSFKIFDSVQVSCHIVFTTAYDEFAIKAFELNSIDFLLKSITKKNIEKSINKYQSNKKLHSVSYLKLIQDLKMISSKSDYKERFPVNEGGGLIIFDAKGICYFYKEKHTYIVVKNGDRYPVNFTLGQLKKFLDPTGFYRINRQFFVNINAISRINLWFKRKLKLQLIPEFEGDVFVSREKASNFKHWIDK